MKDETLAMTLFNAIKPSSVELITYNKKGRTKVDVAESVKAHVIINGHKYVLMGLAALIFLWMWGATEDIRRWAIGTYEAATGKKELHDILGPIVPHQQAFENSVIGLLIKKLGG